MFDPSCNRHHCRSRSTQACPFASLRRSTKRPCCTRACKELTRYLLFDASRLATLLSHALSYALLRVSCSCGVLRCKCRRPAHSASPDNWSVPAQCSCLSMLRSWRASPPRDPAWRTPLHLAARCSAQAQSPADMFDIFVEQNSAGDVADFEPVRCSDSAQAPCKLASAAAASLLCACHHSVNLDAAFRRATFQLNCDVLPANRTGACLPPLTGCRQKASRCVSKTAALPSHSSAKICARACAAARLAAPCCARQRCPQRRRCLRRTGTPCPLVRHPHPAE